MLARLLETRRQPEKLVFVKAWGGNDGHHLGFPSVRVPVLSTTNVSTSAKRSSASAFLMSMPICAPRPVPTMIDIGVARPRAHGQAMMRTDTAVTKANAIAGGGPNSDHATKASTATATTAGTK